MWVAARFDLSEEGNSVQIARLDRGLRCPRAAKRGATGSEPSNRGVLAARNARSSEPAKLPLCRIDDECGLIKS
jgi:hypothetical protein